MTDTAKKWLITAISLSVSGIIIFLAVMTAYGFDFSKLDTEEYKTDTYNIEEDFNDIEIENDTADISFVLSESNNCKVVCYGQKYKKSSATVTDGVLKISSLYDTNKKWYDHIGINIKSQKITLYLPKSEFDSISVKESTGDIDIKNLTANTLNIDVSTGEIKINNVLCQNFSSNGSTGDVILKNVKADNKISIKRSTGNVILRDCDGKNITVKTSTGDVKGTLLSGKKFTAKTSTGDVIIPPSSKNGESCKITTSTGDIKIKAK